MLKGEDFSFETRYFVFTHENSPSRGLAPPVPAGGALMLAVAERRDQRAVTYISPKKSHARDPPKSGLRVAATISPSTVAASTSRPATTLAGPIAATAILVNKNELPHITTFERREQEPVGERPAGGYPLQAVGVAARYRSLNHVG